MSLLIMLDKIAAGTNAARSAKRVTELELWDAWKKSNEAPDKLEPLLQSLRPLITRTVNEYAGNVPIPRTALEAETTRLVIVGLRKYNPDVGVLLSSWLTNQMKGLNRYVIQNQNFARITEERARRIGDYDRAVSHLTDELSQSPTAAQIADHMKVGVRTVNRLANERRADLSAGEFEVDPFVHETPRSREVLRLMYPYELTIPEQHVFEHLMGLNGKTPTTNMSQIARALGISNARVSQLKNAIAKKAAAHLYG